MKKIICALLMIPSLFNAMEPPCKKARLNDGKENTKEIPTLKSLITKKIITHISKQEHFLNYIKNKTIYNVNLDKVTNDVQNLIEDQIVALLHLYTFNHGDSVTAATFSCNGKLILTTSLDKAARIWDATTGTCLKTFEHEGPVRSGVFNHKGSNILTASGDATEILKKVKLIKIDTGGCPQILYHYKNIVNSAKFNHNCSRIVTVASAAQLWNANTGSHLQTFSHNGLIIAATFNHNGTRLLTISDNKIAKLWDTTKEWDSDVVGGATNTDPCLKTFYSQGFFKSALFSPDGSNILTASTDGTARLWDTITGECLQIFNHDAAVSSAVFNHEGTHILTTSDNNTAKLWNAITGELLQTLHHKDCINTAIFNHDGTQLLTASDDKTAKLWDVTTGVCLLTFNHNDSVASALFNYDGTRILTASNSTVKLWKTDLNAPALPARILGWLTSFFS